jgi:hypothetical protein
MTGVHMNRLATFFLLGIIALTLPVFHTKSQAEDSGKKAVSLFDGKTLDGWEGEAKWFRVEDGCIVGGTLKEKIPHNYFLASKKEYKNFDLTLKFKLIGKGVNSGVMLRSQRVPNNSEMTGYQADLGKGWWGANYDETRRNKVLIGPKQEEMDKLVKEEDWNDYRILCEGKRIQLWITGKQTVDYTEKEEKFKGKEIAESGLIGLQIHAGGASEAWFKDISIKELP